MTVVLVNPVNTIQASLNLVPNSHDPRRPGSLASGDYYYDVASFLKENGMEEDAPLLQEYVARPFHPSWIFDREFNRHWVAWERIPHESGEGVYFLARGGLSEDESLEAFSAHDVGYFLTEDYWYYPPRDFRVGDVVFEHLDEMQHPWRQESGFVLYRWTVIDPDVPDMTRVAEEAFRLPEK
jgi:hypothetical protein